MGAPVPNIISGQAIGTVITVKNSTDLSSLSLQGLTVGTQVWNEAVGSYFALTLSSATPVVDKVIAINGLDGLRWVVLAAGGASFVGYPVQYVSPAGDNANNGTLNLPVKTVSKAYSQLTSGGVIYISPNSAWSDGTEGLGLTAGQGCHLGGWEDTHAVFSPDFLKLKTVTFEGWGADTTDQFGDPVVSLLWGGTGANPRLDPGLWIASASAAAFRMNSISISSNCPARVGWDYRRNGDATPAFGNITSATRFVDTDGVTKSTFTVAFPVPWVVNSLQRTSNVTTLIFTCPNVPPFVCLGINSFVTLATTLPDFHSGNYTVDPAIPSVLVQGPLVGQYTLKIADSGADTGLETSGTNTLSGHGCQVGDTIEVQSTDVNWVTSTYYVSGVTNSTITVLDPAGTYAVPTPHGPTANIGQYVLQDRSPFQGVAFDTFEGCTFAPLNLGNPNAFNSGPAMDRGSSSAGGWSWIRGGSMYGTQLNANVDPNRAASIFASGGSHGAPGWQQRDTRIEQGNIRIDAAIAPWIVNLSFITQDSGNSFSRAVVEVIRSGGGSLYCDTIQNADAGNGPFVDLGNLPSLAATIINTPNVFNASQLAQVISIQETRNWPSESLGFEATGKFGWYGDGKLTGRRVDAQSQFGTFNNSGYTDIMQDVGSWTTFSGSPTRTANQNTDGLDGLGNGWLLGGAGQWQSTITIPSSAVGDRFVIGFWAKAPLGTFLNGASYVYLTSVDNSNSETQVFPAFGGDGEWKFFCDVGTVSRAGHTSFFIHWNMPGGGVQYTIYKPFMHYFPAASTSVNEVYRVANTFRTYPPYLVKGMAGTDAGQKLIAHGGLGTAARYVVGVGSGQITLTGVNTKAVELFDESGNSLGVSVLQGFTVNP